MTVSTSADQAPDLSTGILFPHVVCRVAGLPVSCLEPLRAEESSQLWTEIRGLIGQLEGQRDRLVPRIFEAIGRLDESSQRRPLLKLKRDVHNLRSLSTAAMEAVTAPRLRRDLEVYQRALESLEAAQRRCSQVYQRELVAVRSRFQRLVLNEDFRRGLLLSSRTLAAQLSRYVRLAADRPGAKGRQVERSLMRYLSRMVMKPTPFGTFCSLLAGRVEEGTPADLGIGHRAPSRFSGDPQHKTTHLRLNKTIYGRLLPLMIARPAIRQELRVELNPTLREEGDRWVFLAAAGGAEVFQRLPRNPVLDLLGQLLTRGGPKALAVLISSLGSHPSVEASPEEAEAFALKLIELGFLRFRVGIPEQEVDWDAPLRAVLEVVEDEHARLILRFLTRLREAAEQYEAADLDRRRELLEEAVALVRGIFEDLGAPIADNDPALGQLPPFFEDSGGEALLHLQAAGFEDDLRDYVRRALPLASARGEQANMRCFFDRFYGERGEAMVPLLRFYEDYYREHFKGHLERQRPAKQTDAPTPAETSAEPYDLSNPFGLDLITRFHRSRVFLERRIQERWAAASGAEEIELSPGDLDAATAKLPPLTDRCRSVSVFGHLLEDWGPKGEPGLVTGHCLTGFGKYFSRFLYLLPDEVQEALVASNQSLTDELVTEICGDASFNANLHPPLLPWEMSYPTGESGTAEEQILVSELWVEPVPLDSHRLRLRQGPKGREVVPVDLGFLNPRMRPPLFQLLARFSPAANFSLPLPEFLPSPPTTAGASSQVRVQVRPRITYGRLVLARRRWKVFSADLPRRLGAESEAEFFLRLQEWREQVGLPLEVFVKVQVLPQGPPEEPKPEGEEESGEDVSKGKPRKPQPEKPQPQKSQPQIREHLYKPQYIDFFNPILADLFSRLGEGLPAFIAVFEECLPAKGHRVPADGKEYATELVLQLDYPESSEGAAR